MAVDLTANTNLKRLVFADNFPHRKKTSQQEPKLKMAPRFSASATLLALFELGRAGALPLSCDDPSELASGLAYVREICTQTGESFSSPYNPLPKSCKSPTCKVAVDRVSRDCAPLMASDAWFSFQKQMLGGAVAACASTPWPGHSA